MRIRDFVQKLALMDQTQKLEDLFHMTSVLDKDGNGLITIDEFLYYFQQLESDELSDFDKRKNEEELYENIWPDWVVRENKIEQAK